MKYFEELKKAMEYLSSQDNTLFLGQAVTYAGTGITNTLVNIPISKKIEFPVAEELQMGVTNGLALKGFVPISIFPRWNFLLLATNQIVNHLDKIPLYSGYFTNVIIRTAIGSERPLHPQHQHVGDFTEAFKIMCPNIEIIRLEEPEMIFESYQKAYERKDGKSTLLVEYGDFYNEK